jgi:S1-C subfamily serine protease
MGARSDFEEANVQKSNPTRRPNSPQAPWPAWRSRAAIMAVIALLQTPIMARTANAALADVIRQVQPKLVKIYGAGGPRRMEAYQSGMLISDQGHVLTVQSYVLLAETIAVHLSDGRRAEASLVGVDPTLEIAVLKIDAAGLPHFDLSRSVAAEPATPVLALSNLFGIATGREPVSVMHGWISARVPLATRRREGLGLYRGPIYILDAITSNPGAGGGAVVDWQGRLLGMLGKERRYQPTGTWLNYALPAQEMTAAIDAILAGERRPATADAAGTVDNPVTLAELGFALVPDVLANAPTPPFIDAVQADSPAAAAGLKTDDLIVYCNDRWIGSCQQLCEVLKTVERQSPVHLTVQRDDALRDVTLRIGAKP